MRERKYKFRVPCLLTSVVCVSVCVSALSCCHVCVGVCAHEQFAQEELHMRHYDIKLLNFFLKSEARPPREGGRNTKGRGGGEEEDMWTSCGVTGDEDRDEFWEAEERGWVGEWRGSWLRCQASSCAQTCKTQACDKACQPGVKVLP